MVCARAARASGKPPQAFREGFSEVVANEKKAGICQVDKVITTHSSRGRGMGKRTKTPVVRMGISLWPLGM